MNRITKIAVALVSAVGLSLGGTLVAVAAPAELGPAVQVDANCGARRQIVACTASSLTYSNTTRKMAVSSNGTIFAMFHGPEGIRVAKSTDRGATFAPADKLSDDLVEAEIAVSSNDYLYAVWNTGTSVRFSRSTDLGANWSLPVEISTIDGNNGLETVHMAVDGEYVYLITNSSSHFWVSANAGDSFTETANSTNFGNWVYSDVVVDALSHDLYVFVDNPEVNYFKSTDHGQTFSSRVTPGTAVFYSVAAISSSTTGKYMYMSGGAIGGPGGEGTNLEQINLADGTDTSILVDQSIAQGRSLAADQFGNVVVGAVSTNGDLTFQVSNDFGSNFGPTQTVVTAGVPEKVWSSVSINPTNGDVMFLYQNGDDIFLKTYTGYLLGYDLEVSRSSIDFTASNQEQVLTVTNRGSEPYHFVAVGLDGQSFQIIGGTCGDLPDDTINGGSSCTFIIKSSVAANSVFIVAANGPTEWQRSIPLSLGELAAVGRLPVNRAPEQARVIPIFDLFKGPFPVKKTFSLSGKDLNVIETLKLNGKDARIISKSATSIELQLDDVLAAGEEVVKVTPVTSQVTIRGFLPGGSKLTSQMISQIKKVISKGDVKSVVCEGFTSGPTILKGDAKVAKSRATNVCSLIKSIDSSIQIQTSAKATSVAGSEFRKTVLTLTK
jgi:hypothetical protein